MVKKSHLKFTGTISKMGRHRIISVPTALHAFLEEFEGKQLKITVEEQ